MKPVGVGLVGTGMWAGRLAAAVRRTPSLELVSVYGRDEARRDDFAGRFETAAAASFEAAIGDDAAEGVLLVTPNDVHAEQALACAEHGRHVFVEKPIADTVEAGRAMAAAFEDAGLVLLVGHAFRRLGAARRVEEFLAAGDLGRVVLAEANFSLSGTLTPAAWRWYRDRAPGGPLLQLGIHHADTLSHWLGPVAESRGLFGRLVTEAEIDDVGVLSLRFERGALGSLTGSYVSPKTFSVRLYGTEGVLDYRTDMAVWPEAERVDEATRLTLTARDGVRDLDFEQRDMLVEELDEFARAVRGEAVPETGAAEGIAALRVVLEAVPAEERT